MLSFLAQYPTAPIEDAIRFFLEHGLYPNGAATIVRWFYVLLYGYA